MAMPESALDRLQKLHESVIAPPKSFDQEVEHAIAQNCIAIVVDMQTGVIVRATRPAEILFGYGDGELKGRMVHDLVPDEDQPMHRVWFAQYAANPTSRPMGGRGRRLRGKAKDGMLFPVEIGLTAAEIDGLNIAIAFVLPMVLREREVDKTGETPIVSGSVVRIEATK
jgi:PAS domain S-box-containing protein